MERLFYKKSTSIIVVTLAVVLVFLICLLLVTLTQLSGLKSAADRIESMVKNAQTSESALEELKNYKNSNEFVINWAIEQGYLPDDVVQYIQKLDSGK